MPYFALFYETVDGFVERRQPYRGPHLAMIDEAYRKGELVLAGALKPSGALLVFHVDDAAAVQAFANHDPYVLNGLVKSWRVQEWNVVVGAHAVPR
jgi:uncharacterized protein YciI